MIARTTLSVTEYQLEQRINYALRRDGSTRLWVARGKRAAQVGRCYLIDTKSGQVVRTHVDMATLARELGVLQAWERLSE